jgi:hypothetical protein
VAVRRKEINVSRIYFEPISVGYNATPTACETISPRAVLQRLRKAALSAHSAYLPDQCFTLPALGGGGRGNLLGYHIRGQRLMAYFRRAYRQTRTSIVSKVKMKMTPALFDSPIHGEIV